MKTFAITAAASHLDHARQRLQDCLHEASALEAIIILGILEKSAILCAELSNFADAIKAEDSHD